MCCRRDWRGAEWTVLPGLGRGVLLPPVPQYIFVRGFRPARRAASPVGLPPAACVRFAGWVMSYPALAACVAPGCSWWLLAGVWLHWLAASCVLVLGDTRSFSPRTRFARARASVAPLLVLAAGWCGCACVRALLFFFRLLLYPFSWCLHSLPCSYPVLSLHYPVLYTLLCYSASQCVRSLLHFATRSCSLSLSLPDIRIGLYLVFRVAPPSVKSNYPFIINYL